MAPYGTRWAHARSLPSAPLRALAPQVSRAAAVMVVLAAFLAGCWESEVETRLEASLDAATDLADVTGAQDVGGEDTLDHADAESDTLGAGSDSGEDLPDVVAVPDAEEEDATLTDTAGADDSAALGDNVEADTDADPEGGDEVWVVVGHERELRGVWVTTVWNINYPSRQGLPVATMRRELEAIVARVAEVGLNTIFFQVRAEGDAFYASSHEPWSRFLTGRQGDDPGMDPLAELLEMAHARGLEVHAWLNPYRARTSTTAALHPTHMAARWPRYAYPYGSGVWMDPGAVEVQGRLLAVVDDLVARYRIDGLHFDDYFYPYPDGPFPDDATYAAYLSGGGTMVRDDWRRDNVNRMVAAVHERIQAADPSVRFGISPFGIYRPGQPPGIRGLDQYAAIFADPLRWMEEGWLDYVAPQLYWPTTRTAQAYLPLLRWWTEVNPLLYVFPGNYLSQLGTSAEWTLDEFREQLRLTRSLRSGQAMGNIWFQVQPLMRNTQGVGDVFRDEFYVRPALTPVLTSAPPVPARPLSRLWREETHLRWEVDQPEALRNVLVYRQGAEGWSLERVLPRDARSLPIAALQAEGPYALSVVTRDGRESLGWRVPAAPSNP